MNDLVAEIERMQQMSGPDLQARYLELHGRPPRSKNRAWLVRRCCWTTQENALGGLRTAAKRRLSALMAEISLPRKDEHRVVTGELSHARRSGDLAPGSCVERIYRNERLILRAISDGYVVEGCATVDPSTVHRSLSAAAESVASQHVNGRVWWGLARRKKTS